MQIFIIKMFDFNAKVMSYSDFAKNNNKFTLEIYPKVIELEIGESVDVLVYAVGKNDDWSLYWYSDEEYLVNCEWGEWLEENNDVCPLTIRGEREGTATVTIYSDVDFKGKTVTVHVKKTLVENYQSSCVKGRLTHQ